MVDLPAGFRVVKKAGGVALPPGFKVVQPGAVAPAPMAPAQPATPEPQPTRVPIPDLFYPTPIPGFNMNLGGGYVDVGGTPDPTLRAPQDDPLRALEIGFQGMRRGAASIPGTPVDLMNAVINLGAMGVDAAVPGEQPWRPDPKPFLGTEFNTDVIENLMPGEPYMLEEMTPSQRIGYEVNNFATQALVPATAASKAATMAPGKIAPALEPFVRPYRTGATPVSDAIAGGGAGATYGAYEEFVPEDIKNALGPVGEIIAMLGGASGANLLENAVKGGARTLTGAAKNTVTGGVDPSLPANEDGSFVKTKDADLAALYAQGQASNPAKAGATIKAKANELGEYPQAIPTAGPLSDDPGLTMFERGFRQDPNVSKNFVTRDQATERAALDSAKKIAPETAVGRAFTDTIEGQHNQRVNVAQRRRDWTEEHLSGVNARGVQDTTALEMARGSKPAASEALDQTVTGNLVEAQTRKNTAFSEIDPTGAEYRDPDALLNVADQIDARAGGRLNDPAGRPQGWMDRIRGLVGEDGTVTQVSFRELNTLRPELSSQIAAARKAGNYTLADNLSSIKGVIDSEAERLAAQGGEAGERALNAMREYRQFADVWARGPGSEANKFRKDFNLDRHGRTTTQPSQTAARFMQPGKPEKAADLRRIVGNDAGGQTAAGDFLFADLAEAGVVRGGRIDPNAVRQWMSKWGDEAINLSPQFRHQIDDLLQRADVNATDAGILSRQLHDAVEQLAEAQQDTAAIRTVLGKDPVKAVAAIFASGDPERNVRDLMAEVANNETARNGLKAAVREYLMERATNAGISRTGTGENPLSFAKLDEIFKAHENVLASIFTPEEMHSLNVAHKFLAPLKNLEMRAITGSQTSANEKLWNSLSKPLEVALKLRFGVLKGGGLMRTISLWKQMLPNGDEAAMRLIERMWFDPELAAHLLTRNVSQIGSSSYNRKLIRLLSYGVGARDLVQPDVENRDQR